MTLKEYMNWLNRKRANKNISDILLKQKHKDISKKVSLMLEARR